ARAAGVAHAALPAVVGLPAVAAVGLLGPRGHVRERAVVVAVVAGDVAAVVVHLIAGPGDHHAQDLVVPVPRLGRDGLERGGAVEADHRRVGHDPDLVE